MIRATWGGGVSFREFCAIKHTEEWKNFAGFAGSGIEKMVFWNWVDPLRNYRFSLSKIRYSKLFTNDFNLKMNKNKSKCTNYGNWFFFNILEE